MRPGNPWTFDLLETIDHTTRSAFNLVSKYLRAAGTSCFSDRKDVCKEIQEYALEWANSGGPSFTRSWTGTLVANMRLLNPLASALAIAEASQSMSRGGKGEGGRLADGESGRSRARNAP